MAQADKAYLSGVGYRGLEPLFESAARSQDLEAARWGVDKLHFRLIGARWGGAFGHLAHLETMVKLRELGMLSEEPRFLALPKVSNRHLYSYWQDYFDELRMSPGAIATLNSTLRPLQETVSFFRLREHVVSYLTAIAMANTMWGDRPAILNLNDVDRAWGWRELERHLGKSADWFVALHVRESSGGPRSAVDGAIRSYLPAIRLIIEKGGAVVRLGDRSMQALPEIPGVIDTTQWSRSERFDVFSLAACRFLIGTPSGPLFVAQAFGAPTLYTQAIIGLTATMVNTRVLPQRHAVSNGADIPIRQLAGTNQAHTVNPSVDPEIHRWRNTEAEIRGATLEMLALTEAGGFKSSVSKAQEFARKEIREAFGETHDNVLSTSSYLLGQGG